jgi:hypothetical protein
MDVINSVRRYYFLIYNTHIKKLSNNSNTYPRSPLHCVKLRWRHQMTQILLSKIKFIAARRCNQNPLFSFSAANHMTTVRQAKYTTSIVLGTITVPSKCISLRRFMELGKAIPLRRFFGERKKINTHSNHCTPCSVVCMNYHNQYS